MTPCLYIIRIIFKLIPTAIVTLLIFLPKSASTLEITAVGDIYLSQKTIESHRTDLSKIKLSGDIVFANFEGLLSRNHTKDDRYRLKLTMPPSAVNILKKIGINTMSLANNHAMDMGLEQYERTSSELINSGFQLAGLDDNGTVIRIGNLNVRFIAFSFSGVNDVNDLEKTSRLIRSFKEDIIVVSAHMGAENYDSYRIPNGMEYFNNEQRGNVRKFARTCIDAGASLIIGHGPHILRGIELYKNKLIIYSLGNFIFDYPGVEKHGNTPTLAITTNIRPNGDFNYAQITSYSLKYGIPHPDPYKKACRVIKTLSMEMNDKSLIINTDCSVNRKGEEK